MKWWTVPAAILLAILMEIVLIAPPIIGLTMTIMFAIWLSGKI